MHFSVLCVTKNNPKGLQKTKESLQLQTYKEWEFIVINNSPNNKEYIPFATSINDHRIHYKINDIKLGENKSKNKALRETTVESDWVIFIEEGEWFSPDALQTFRNTTLNNPGEKWFLANKSLQNGKPLAFFPKSEQVYPFIWHCLLRKRNTEDLVHCIETKIATKASFLEKINSGESWFYFYQIALKTNPYYYDHNSVVTTSPNNRKSKPLGLWLEQKLEVFKEGFRKKMLRYPSFILCAIRNI